MNTRINAAIVATSCMFAIASTGCSLAVEDGSAELEDVMTEGETAESMEAACAHPTNYPWDQPKYAEVKSATTIARDQICKGYVLGTQGPNTFDCSGLAFYAYRNAGFPVTRLSAQGIYNAAKNQSGGVWGSLVGDWEKRAGDLLFYSSGCGTTNISHVSIYMGVNHDNNKPEIVQALNPSTGVVLSGLNSTGLCQLSVVGRVKF